MWNLNIHLFALIIDSFNELYFLFLAGTSPNNTNNSNRDKVIRKYLWLPVFRHRHWLMTFAFIPLLKSSLLLTMMSIGLVIINVPYALNRTWAAFDFNSCRIAWVTLHHRVTCIVFHTDLLFRTRLSQHYSCGWCLNDIERVLNEFIVLNYCFRWMRDICS